MSNKIEEKYVEIIRKKSGDERIKIAMELRKLVLEMAEAGIKDQNPNISPEDLKACLQERIYGFSFPFKKSNK